MHETDLPPIPPEMGGASSDEARRNDPLATDHLRADLTRRSIRGGAARFVARFARYLLNLASLAVLARILTPGDFGLIAMVSAIVGFAATFKDMGLSIAAVQRQDVTQSQMSSLFWLNGLFTLLLSLLVAAAAPLVAGLYGEPRLVAVTLALASGLVMKGLAAQHIALLQRQMRFSRLAVIEIVAQTAGIAVGVGAAVAGARYWALVARTLTAAAVLVLGAWIACPWRPGLPTWGRGVRSMLRFGAAHSASQLCAYAVNNVDDMLIGWYWGARALGLYERAYHLLLLPVRVVSGPPSSVVVSGLCRLQDRPDEYRAHYVRSLRMIVALAMPVVAVSFVAAEEIMLLFLGPQWIGAATIFRALAILALVRTTSVATGWVFVSLGRADRALRWNMISAPAMILTFFLTLKHGIVVLAIGHGICALLLRAAAIVYCCRGTPLRPGDVWRAIALPFLASLAAGAGGWQVGGMLPTGLSVPVRLCVLASVSMICYLLVSGATEAGRAELRQIVRAFRSAVGPKDAESTR